MLTSSLLITSIQNVSNERFKVVVAVEVKEDATDLTDQLISASINWGDGDVNTESVRSANGAGYVSDIDGKPAYSGTIANEYLHNYGVGTYRIRLISHNYRSPVQDKLVSSYVVTLKGLQSTITEDTIIVGPISPSDAGFPNSDQWSLDIDKNLKLLASNVKNVLTTGVGERTMEPTFGTNIRRMIFNPLDAPSIGEIETEIRRALSIWEPRVRVNSIQRRTSGNSVYLNLDLVSLLDRQNFKLDVQFSQ
jgi:phage baseplate assembly protein W